MKTLKIRVTKADIAKAAKVAASGKQYLITQNCPIAQAVRRRFKITKRTNVGIGYEDGWCRANRKTVYFADSGDRSMLTYTDLSSSAWGECKPGVVNLVVKESA